MIYVSLLCLITNPNQYSTYLMFAYSNFLKTALKSNIMTKACLIREIHNIKDEIVTGFYQIERKVAFLLAK